MVAPLYCYRGQVGPRFCTSRSLDIDILMETWSFLMGIQQARLSPNESISRGKAQLRNHTMMSTEEASWLLQSASTVGRREGVTSSFSRLSLSQWIRQVESVVTQFVSFVWMLVKRLKLINRKGQTRLRREQRIGQTLLPKQASVGRRNDLADECCDHFTVVDVLMC